MPTEQNRDDAGQDGSIRKAHYGDGRQPWDDIVDAGWGPFFAASNVLKYIRRTKNPEHSFESACWYYKQLMTRGNAELKISEAYPRPWRDAWKQLATLLTPDEQVRIVNHLKAAAGGPTRTKA